MMNILIKETGKLKIFLIIITFIFTLIYSISSVFGVFSLVCYGNIDYMIDSEDEMIYDFRLNNISSKEKELLKNSDLENISYSLSYSEMFFKDSCVLSGSDKLSVNPVILQENDIISGKISEERLVQGESLSNFSVDTEEAVPVWVTKKFAVAENIKCNDLIDYSSNVTESPICLKVCGIYSDLCGFSDIAFEFESLKTLMRSQSVSIKTDCVILVKGYFKGRETENFLSENNFKFSCLNFENINENIEYFFDFCSILFLVSISIMAISIAVIISYGRYVFVTRRRYVSLLLVIGMTGKKIATIYCCILEAVILISSMLSFVVIKILYDFIIEMFYKTFDIKLLYSDFPNISIIFIVGFSSLLMMINYIYMRIKLKRIDILNGLRGSK